jgi:16S rRNA processing protein RimM
MTTREPRDRIILGHISGAHGIRGEVVVKSYTDDPADIAAYGPLSDEADARTFKFLKVRIAKKGVIAVLEGVKDRNAAEALRGTQLFVERSRLPEPDEEEYYHADLVGLAVVSQKGEKIGEVVAIQNFGAGDLLEYRLEGKRRTEFLPFNEAFVPEIDLDAGHVRVELPEMIDGEDRDNEGRSGDEGDK